MNAMCVLIPHYNAVADLKHSLASISSDESVDVLVVDDGSPTPPMLDDIRTSFRGNGEVFLVRLEQNSGIETALNTGLRFIISRGYLFTARLDAGDLCAPSRFHKQQGFLEEHPDVYLVGAWVRYISADNSVNFNGRFPTEDREIKRRMYYENVLIHPVVAFRTDVVDHVGFYPYNYPACEDYAWFMRITRKLKVAIIPEFLLDYIMTPGSISHTRRKKQTIARVRIVWNNFRPTWYWCLGIVKFIALLIIPYKLLKTIKGKILR